MRNMTESAEPVLDIWPYVDAVDLGALGFTDLTDVRYVYRDASDRLDHVLIGTGNFNTVFVVVVDRILGVVKGHHVLDLNERFGLGED
ncbi:hypothetical protein CIW49_21220 [Mycolicibacterium sp. P1-18]|nr:hypothetical protein CIW49_21220 [Mycolicibacterium sp. P1-18]